MVHGEGFDPVLAPRECGAGLQFSDVDRKRGALATKADALTQRFSGATGRPQPEALGSSLECHRPDQAGDAKDVIGMGMRKKEVLERKGDSETHHLALRPLAAIEQQGLPLPNEREGCDAPFDGGA
jgi:hypothetical protein